jgi:hypothetical protein
VSNSSAASRGFPAILWGGLIAGVLDISDAFVFHAVRGVKPIRILQAIASGLLGPGAFQGGLRTAVLGAALHFSIAFSAAAVYYLASRKMSLLTRRPYFSGLVYGIAVYLFMNLVALPLSATAAARYSAVIVINGLLAHMLFVGLPISIVVHRFSTPQ